jgi:protein TonB
MIPRLPIKHLFLPESVPASSARASFGGLSGVAAFTVSIAVHGMVILGYAALRTEPPRLASARTIEVALTGGAPAVKASPRPPAPAPKPIDRKPPLPVTPEPETTVSPAEATPTAPTPTNTADRDAGDGALTEARYDVAALNNPKPPYPLAVRRRGIEGRVVLTAKVRIDGGCEDVRLKQSSGHEALDAAALDTVRKWRFLPARRAGQAVEAWVEVPIVFKLES